MSLLMIDDFYLLMIIGVVRDKVMAVHYYRLAADQGYAPAQVMTIF
jgi:TPR repeat protein